MKTCCVVVAVTLGSLAAAPGAAAVTDFVTPHGAIYCGVSHGEPPLALICWRPRDGLTLSMTQSGRVRRQLHPRNRGYHDPAPGRVLRFGQTWTLSGYWRCVSRTTGLTCTNRSGHGWRLSRRGSRLF